MPTIDFVSPDAAELRAPPKNIVDSCISNLVNAVRAGNPRNMSNEGSQIEELQNEITVFEAALLAVGNGILTHASSLKKRLNDIRPIHRLPIELFTEILLRDLQREPAHVSRVRRLWQLALVCSKWWKTISLGSLFWTDIAYQRDDVDLFLHKSQNALINIQLTSFYHEEGSEFIETVSTACHRWKSITFSIPNKVSWDLPEVLLNPMPELQDIQIELRTKSHSSEEQTVLHLQDLPKLQHLCLVNVGLGTENLRLEHLTSLQLWGVENPELSLAWLSAVLIASPGLEQLALKEVRFATELDFSTTTILLPRLRSLQLATLEDKILRTLLSAIESPQLTALKLECPETWFTDDLNHPAERKLVKLLSPIVVKMDAIAINVQSSRNRIEVTSTPEFGRRQPEWVSWAGVPQCGSLHLGIPTEDTRRGLECILSLLSAAGLDGNFQGRVRLDTRGGIIHSGGPNEGCLTAKALSKLPTLTHISAVDSADVRVILQYLGSCRQDSEGTWSFPCPRLQSLDIEDADGIELAEELRVFTENRIGDGEPFYHENQAVQRPPPLKEFGAPAPLLSDSGSEMQSVNEDDWVD